MIKKSCTGLCAFDCRVQLECFIFWVWEPLSSISLVRPFLAALKKHGLTTQHQALGFQKDGWSCSVQGLHITNWCGSLGFFFGCYPHPNRSKFCQLCVE